MTPVLLALLLGAASVALAGGGPWLLRRAAPALVRVPRLAIAVAGGGVLVWLGGVLAVGPVLAWAGSGPVLLPGRAAEVCQRCLAAANPFSAVGSDTVVPAAVLLAVPAALATMLAAGVAAQLVARERRSRTAASQLAAGAVRRRLHGHDVAVVETDQPVALALPARHGGIVLSTGAIRALDDHELAAVLAHEDAHLRERHHLASAIVESVAACLPWVPLVSAAADAVPHYLEIAADNRARRHAGTPALVGALLKLGERTQAGLSGPGPVPALHAAGPERIRQLVQPVDGPAGALPAAVVGTLLVTLSVLSAAVLLPYASASLNGCV